MDFREELIKLRKEKKINQKEMGKALGVSRSTIYRFEKGEMTLTWQQAIKYASRVGYVFYARKKDAEIEMNLDTVKELVKDKDKESNKLIK